MPEDNVLPFPNKMRDAIDADHWVALQGEFYLDCFNAQHGRPAADPEELRVWLEQAQLFADVDNPFFRGWLVRRLSETDH
ncbi:MAG: hypothetical protein LJE59_05895 [Chromatiaceae bacterium]|jgi:hypothetical protein|nr:hypothetical protein [Chromatiaceae bacterium]